MGTRTIQRRLRGRQSAKWVAEGASRRARSGRAVAGSGENELWTEGPLIDEAVAQHALGARVVEDAETTAQAGLAVAEYIVGKANAWSKTV